MAFLGLPPEFIPQSPKLLETVALVGIEFSNYNTWERVHIVGSLGDSRTPSQQQDWNPELVVLSALQVGVLKRDLIFQAQC